MSLGRQRRAWWQKDLLEPVRLRKSQSQPSVAAPPFGRGPAGKFSSLLLANDVARREGKALLFGELAEATRQGMPLETALAHCSQTLGEAMTVKRPIARGAESRHRWWGIFWGTLLGLTGTLAHFLYALTGFRMIDGERISRLLALRLLGSVQAGHGLADAMRRHRRDFDSAEVQMVAAGEKWGKLPEALKRVSEFQVTERQLMHQSGTFAYPLWLGAFLLTLLAFYLVFIAPKFVDIYAQLGAELPPLTQTMIELSGVAANGLLLIPLAIIIIVSALLLLRLVMNGSRTAKVMLSVGMFTAFMIELGPADYLFRVILSMLWFGQIFLRWGTYSRAYETDSFSSSMDGFSLFLISIGLAVLLLIAIPYLLSWLEGMVLYVERRMRSLLRVLPYTRRALKTEADARFLSALNLGLVSGLAAPEAVETAGEVVGGKRRHRARKAAELVAAGHPLGAACVKAGALQRETAYQLALLDGRPNFLERLQALTDHALLQGQQQLTRSAKVGELVSVVLMGLIVGGFVVAMYLPLFNIPRVMLGQETMHPVTPITVRESLRPNTQTPSEGGKL